MLTVVIYLLACEYSILIFGLCMKYYDNIILVPDALHVEESSCFDYFFEKKKNGKVEWNTFVKFHTSYLLTPISKNKVLTDFKV